MWMETFISDQPTAIPFSYAYLTLFLSRALLRRFRRHIRDCEYYSIRTLACENPHFLPACVPFFFGVFLLRACCLLVMCMFHASFFHAKLSLCLTPWQVPCAPKRRRKQIQRQKAVRRLRCLVTENCLVRWPDSNAKKRVLCARSRFRMCGDKRGAPVSASVSLFYLLQLQIYARITSEFCNNM